MSALPLKLRKVRARDMSLPRNPDEVEESATWITQDGLYMTWRTGAGWILHRHGDRTLGWFPTRRDAVWAIYDNHYATDRQGPTALDEVLS